MYGKLATSSDSSFKVAYIKEDGSLGFYVVEEHKKTHGIFRVVLQLQVMQGILQFVRHKKTIMEKINVVLFTQTRILYTATLNPMNLKALKSTAQNFAAGN